MKSFILVLLMTIILSFKPTTDSANFAESLDSISTEKLEAILLKRKMENLVDMKLESPVDLSYAKGLVNNYIIAMKNKYSIENANTIERSVLLPYSEIDASISLLKFYYQSTYPDANKFQYRIYFGKNNSVNQESFPTGHTAIVRLCYDSINIPDLISIPQSSNTIRTIFNVGNICPPNCPGVLATQDDMYHQ
ncbi:MAG: hypothetical protein IPM48_05690 [Saprospiraceae bacterium]|nr:hypothetical protein [Saprospiraceae bacterium]